MKGGGAGSTVDDEEESMMGTYASVISERNHIQISIKDDLFSTFILSPLDCPDISR